MKESKVKHEEPKQEEVKVPDSKVTNDVPTEETHSEENSTTEQTSEEVLEAIEEKDNKSELDPTEQARLDVQKKIEESKAEVAPQVEQPSKEANTKNLLEKELLLRKSRVKSGLSALKVEVANRKGFRVQGHLSVAQEALRRKRR